MSENLLNQPEQIDSKKDFDFRDPLILELIARGVPPDLVAKIEQRLLDNLTGLPKAETCIAVINSALACGEKVVVEFDDLMYLKTYNDLMGHEKTNEMLRAIANILKNNQDELRQKGVQILIGRYAGDEFLKIIIGLSKEEAAEFLNLIDKEFRKMETPTGAFFRPHFSRGIASSEEMQEASSSKLIELADQRAREGKEKIRQKLEKLAETGGRNSRAAQFLRKVRRYG